MDTAKPIKPNIIIGTHNGSIHTDETFACSVLKLIEPSIKIIRSRDEGVLSQADILVDIGSKYSAYDGYFDHHQENFNERHPAPMKKYEFGPKLSGFGLIWRHYGRDAITTVIRNHTATNGQSGYTPSDEGIDFIWEQINRGVVCPVDALDNGEGSMFYMETGVYRQPTISKYIQSLMPTHDQITPEMEDAAFHEAMVLTCKYLSREIIRGFALYNAVDDVLDQVRQVHPDDGILILNQFVPWSPIFTKNKEATAHIKMVVFRSGDDSSWMVQSPYFVWRTDKNKFSETVNGEKRERRYPAPKHICGKQNAELNQILGISDGIFVHPSGFIGATRSLESSLIMAKYWINNPDPA